jgi:hypothetical protein
VGLGLHQLTLQAGAECRGRQRSFTLTQARTGRGIHGLPKVSPGPAQPLYTLRAGHPFGGRPAAVFFPLGYPTPYGPALTR